MACFAGGTVSTAVPSTRSERKNLEALASKKVLPMYSCFITHTTSHVSSCRMIPAKGWRGSHQLEARKRKATYPKHCLEGDTAVTYDTHTASGANFAT